ncbi:MAG: gliding motility protein GldM, partial [Bacteroidota bacterium]
SIQSEAQFVSVSCDKLNVIYIGVDNPITIAVSNYDVSKIFVKVDSGIISGENGHYNWKIFRHAFGGANIYIYTKINGIDSLLDKLNYRVKRVPEPVLKVGGMSNSKTINIMMLRAQRGIAAVLENFDFNCPASVTEFEVQVNDEKFTHCETFFFPEWLLKKIYYQQIKTLNFRNIKVEMCGGQIYEIHEYKLFVSEYKMESKKELRKQKKYVRKMEKDYSDIIE